MPEKKTVKVGGKLPRSSGYLVYDPSLCTGCRTCELICSAVKNSGTTRPSLSRIQVFRDPFDPTVHNFEPMPCMQCDKPHCILACPVEGAMFVDEKTGARCVNDEKCDPTKCHLDCIAACGSHYGVARILFDPDRNKAIKCDLCGGDPQCVKWCPNNALRYISLTQRKEMGRYEVDFAEPYTKDFGPTYTPYEGYKVTFEKAYPYLAAKEKKEQKGK